MSENFHPPVTVPLGPGSEDPTVQAQLMMQMALSSTAPRIHANSLGLGVTGGDIMVTLWSNGAPSAVINLPFPVAKSLVIELGNVLKDVEAGLERQIPTPRDIQEGIARVQKSGTPAVPSAGQ